MEMVSREYLLKAFNAFNDTEHAPEGWMNAMRTAREIVEDAPMVGTGKVGRWKKTDAFPHRVYCSVCYKTYVPSDEWAIWENSEGLHKVPRNFCPNCGADMRGEET